MHVACYKGHTQCIQALLATGANPQCRNALHAAVQSRDSIEAARTLLAADLTSLC